MMIEEVKEALSAFLEPFKAEEEEYVHAAVYLAGDKDSQKFLSTWSMLPIQWSRPVRDPPVDSRERWDWLWEGVNIDWADLANRTGLNSARLQKLFEPLRANRLLYPDGTVAGHALGILKAEVVKTMPKTK